MSMIRKNLRPMLALILCLSILTGWCAAAAEAVLPLVSITGESLTGWKDKKDIRNAVLTYEDPVTGETFTQSITIKPQGTSSLGYDKKNFTIVLQEAGVEMQPGWGLQTEYCLKANYIDPTHAGNVVSARLVAQMNSLVGLFEGLPNRGAVDGFPIWVTLNDEDEGLYTWNIPKAAWMFGMDEENPNHIVLCCEGWSKGASFRADTFEIDTDWSLEVGPDTPEMWAKFQRVVDFVVNADDETFVRDFDQYLNLDACLDYICFICVSFAVDNEAKNMLMATWDGEVWYPMLYDLDTLWGFDWDGKSMLDAERISGLEYGCNGLLGRIWHQFRPELEERYALLRSTVLSEENIWKEFDSFAAGIPEEAFEWDQARWNPDGERIRTYEGMKEQMDAYLPTMDEIMGYTAE
ncbi:MAG: CotH kinase family protein [Aristaeellaceae bacterium]